MLFPDIGSRLAVELQRCRVDAVAQPRGLGTVVEHVPEVGVADGADHFGPVHEKSVVVLGSNVCRIDRLPIAGPAAAGIELVRGAEELRPAAHAAVNPVSMVIPISA